MIYAWWQCPVCGEKFRGHQAHPRRPQPKCPHCPPDKDAGYPEGVPLVPPMDENKVYPG